MILPPRDRLRRILSLALPIIGGMVSQNVLNLIDTAMVGVLGDTALAAVGMGGITNFLVTSFILGLGAGVQAMAARRVGEKRDDETASPLNGGLLIAVSTAVPWAILLWITVPYLFPYLVDDHAVVDQGVPYLRARLCAMAAMGMNFCFRGYWNATDRSALYMRTLVVMHVSNIVLNYLLIYGSFGFPELGAPGAGVASAIATWLGTFYYFGLAFKHARSGGFFRALPDMKTMKTMVRLSLPASIQQFFFSSGMTAFYWICGLVGTAQLAAANVTINLLLVGLLPGLGFGLASMSLVGQALGRKDPVDARRWGWQVSRVAVVTVFVLALPGVIFPDLLLMAFIHDETTRALAVWPLRLVAFTLCFDAIGMVLMNSLLGAGDSTRVMYVSIGLQWILFLPVAYLVGHELEYGLTAIFVVQIVYRGIQTGVFVQLWRGKHWTTIKV